MDGAAVRVLAFAGLFLCLSPGAFGYREADRTAKRSSDDGIAARPGASRELQTANRASSVKVPAVLAREAVDALSLLESDRFGRTNDEDIQEITGRKSTTVIVGGVDVDVQIESEIVCCQALAGSGRDVIRSSPAEEQALHPEVTEIQQSEAPAEVGVVDTATDKTALQADVSDLQESKTELQSQVAGLLEQESDLERTIGQLQNQLAGLLQERDELEAEIESLKATKRYLSMTEDELILGMLDAIEDADAETVELILEAGLDVNSVIYDPDLDVYAAYRPEGGTMLHYAALYNEVDCARALLDAGADVDARNAYGATALFAAAVARSVEVGKLLIESGAEVDARDANGATALLCACIENQTEMVEMLVAADASTEIADYAGNTPWSVGCSYWRT